MNAMNQKASFVVFIGMIVVAGAFRSSPQPHLAVKPSTSLPQPMNCAPLLFKSEFVAKYPPNAKPGFRSPEEVSAFLEKRWPLADIRRYAIPERRHNDEYQNLVVVGFSKVWSGRLYCGQ